MSASSATTRTTCGGEVSLESEPGTGTRVGIILPICRSEESQRSIVRSARARGFARRAALFPTSRSTNLDRSEPAFACPIRRFWCHLSCASFSCISIALAAAPPARSRVRAPAGFDAAHMALEEAGDQPSQLQTSRRLVAWLLVDRKHVRRG